MTLPDPIFRAALQGTRALKGRGARLFSKFLSALAKPARF
jgi:hypothetical protein